MGLGNGSEATTPGIDFRLAPGGAAHKRERRLDELPQTVNLGVAMGDAILSLFSYFLS